ncbi:hypothetical protein A1OE_508 [Candidatus Endolissoclinum faulkneri L2]|uniref:Uncharacterized protein n=1 Tax=Candidatus Endolissoclinum faulkneri L2 TaxID=1193729 RepID=K7ZCL6_9PROT|nr:hypothetical protein A1OE_508 [Candidatus Endolissoclinum faulkneri L2]
MMRFVNMISFLLGCFGRLKFYRYQMPYEEYNIKLLILNLSYQSIIQLYILLR